MKEPRIKRPLTWQTYVHEDGEPYVGLQFDHGPLYVVNVEDCEAMVGELYRTAATVRKLQRNKEG